MPNRGFGFVRGHEDGISRFMHCRDVKPRSTFDTMYEGQTVEFTPSDEGPKDKGDGLRAVNVSVVKEGE